MGDMDDFFLDSFEWRDRLKRTLLYPGNQSIDIFNENDSDIPTFTTTKNDKDDNTQNPIRSFLESR